MKKLILASICAAMAAVSFASCGSSGSSSSAANSSSSASESTTESAASDFDTAHKINVCSREDGSGTRGAFIELMGIEQ